MNSKGSIYQIKITLKGIKPPIWRRVQVEGNISLHILHRILNSAMGWTNSHLYQFRLGGTFYGIPDTDRMDAVKNSDAVKLSHVIAAEKAKFIYEYDFGDGWEHEVVV